MLITKGLGMNPEIRDQRKNLLENLQKSHRRLQDVNILEVTPAAPGVIIWGTDESDKDGKKAFVPTAAGETANIRATVTERHANEIHDVHSKIHNRTVLNFEALDSKDERKKRCQQLNLLLFPPPTKEKSRLNMLSKIKAKLKRKPGWIVMSILLPIGTSLFLYYLTKIAEPQTGTLLIQCNIDSARVYVNSQFFGVTQADTVVQFDGLKPGQYSIDVIRTSLDSVLNQVVTISKGEVTTLPVRLIKYIPQKAGITIPKPPAPKKEYTLIVYLPVKFENAKIFINRQWRGNGNNTFRLSAGRYGVQIRADSLCYEELVTIPDRSLINLQAKDFKPCTTGGK
jgi:hypothetical protein